MTAEPTSYQPTDRGALIHNGPEPELAAACRRDFCHELALDLAGCPVTIQSNDPSSLAQVSPFFQGLEAGASSDAAIRVYLGLDPSRGRPYRVVSPAGRYVESDTWEVAFAYLMSIVHAEAWAASPNLLPLHCAAAARDGGALLIPAGSGGGKTTLALELAQAGWEYLSDEFAPIEMETLRVRPFPRPLHVSGEAVAALLGPEAIQELAPTQFKDDSGEARYLVAPPTEPSAESYPARYIVFPQRGGAQLELLPLAREEALGLLAPSLLAYHDDMAWRLRALEALVQLLAGAACCRATLAGIGKNAVALSAALPAEPEAAGQDELAALAQVAARVRELLASG